jgi:hypothetical protein
MPTFGTSSHGDFLDRRNVNIAVAPTGERRQFSDSHSDLSPPARELALSIDGYKLEHRRRFVTHEELLSVILSLGYTKNETPA